MVELGTAPEQFIWASGMENTFVPQTKLGHRSLDEYQLMNHYQHWREDLRLAREVGINTLRWGIPWYRVEPLPGEFDWHWTDEVIPYIVNELQVTPIIDLMHYGCPFWLRREFASPEYPIAVSRYIAAFVERYAGLVHWYTPLNEPVVNSLMCGKRGLWPPYLRGDGGYIRVMLQLAKGILRSVPLIKKLDPKAVLVHVEAAGLSRAAREDLESLAAEDNHRGYLCYDLLTGRVDREHPLYSWLVRNGASPDELSEISSQRIQLDVLGLNFYPQWSAREFFITPKGKVASRAIAHDEHDFGKLIEDYYNRYKSPVILTETSAFGADMIRSSWLQSSTGVIKELRAKGVPVLGYTWFPMFTMIDWRYRYGKLQLDDYRIELGLYKLSGSNRDDRWLETPLVSQFRGYINKSAEVIGKLNASGQKIMPKYELSAMGV
jgi:beta-glucosidase